MMIKKANVSMCLIVKNEPFLEKCILSFRDHIEELVIVDTGSTDGTIEVAKKYADIFESYSDCNDPTTGLIEDFSKARNRSFALATKPWVAWCDADDLIEGAEKLSIVLDSYDVNNKNSVCFLFPYEYSYNEQGKCNCLHYRERLVSNKDSVHWTNPVHEVLIPYDNSSVSLIIREELVFKHRRQFSPKQMESGRNLRILRKHFEKTGKSDARQMYYLGLECCNNGLIDEAINLLTEYVDVSGWDDERAMACLKLTDIYMSSAKYSDALKWAFKTIEIKHNWCEGYFVLAKIFYFLASAGGPHEIDYWQKVVYFTKHGFTLPPTKTLLFINPQDREYEIHKFLNMAFNKLGDITGALESVTTALAAQPDDVALSLNKKLYEDFLYRQKIAENVNGLYSNNTIDQKAVEQIFAIINGRPIPHINPSSQITAEIFEETKPTISNGLDIVFYIGDGVEIWTPETFKKTGLGGSETMALENAKRLVALGHRVRVYASCGATGKDIYDGVEYYQTKKYQDLTCDVLIVSRNAAALDDQFNISSKLKLLWVHDVCAGNATNKRLLKADKILALSEWHKQNIINVHNIHSDHIVVTRNGIDLNRFSKQPLRNKFKCINSSSPDRSWPILLECWPYIKALVPRAELHLYYGFKNWEASAINYPGQPELIARLKQQIFDMKPMEVFYHDRINQEELSTEFLTGGVWIHPTWFTETSCITAMEAQAAGLRIVTSSIAALNETVGERGALIDGDWTSPEYKKLFIDSVAIALQKNDDSDRQKLQEYAVQHFGLDQLAKDWSKMFYDLIELKKINPLVPYYPTNSYRNVSITETNKAQIELVNIVKSRKPKVSVLDLTNRVGGMDILFESMKAQSHQDFELIIVDALYKYRKDIVAEKAKQYNFSVKHIEPYNNTFPISSYNNSMNTGLCAAEGEILHFTCDYAFMQKDTLAVHVNFHNQTPRTHILMLPCHDAPVKLEAVSNYFPKHRQYGHRGQPAKTQLLTVPEADYVKAHNEWSDRYVEDLNNGFLENVLWGIFKEPFIYEQGIDHLVQNIVIDTKFSNCSKTEPTPAFHDLNCVKNDSFKLDLLMEANGFDEKMDGTWGFFDTELSRRLLHCHGAQFFAMDTMGDTVINTRYYLEPRKIINGYQNIQIIDTKYNKEQPLMDGAVANFKKRNSK